MVTQPDPRKGPVDRTPPTGRLTVTYLPKQLGSWAFVPDPVAALDRRGSSSGHCHTSRVSQLRQDQTHRV